MIKEDKKFTGRSTHYSGVTTLFEEDKMRYAHMFMVAGSLVFAGVMTGCGTSPELNKEASTSAIRAAEEVGASTVPTAALYLQLAKEELESAKALSTKGEKEQAESMLSRSQADGELAVALSRGDADKTEATKAIERVRQLRQDNQLSRERK
jgi:hypothetical protein